MWFCVLTATFALVLFTILGFAGPLHWWVDLFAQFRAQYVLILAGLALLLVLGRRWKAGAIAGLAIVANLAVLLPHAEPSPGPPAVAQHGPLVRCVSLNLLQGNKKYTEVERFLRETNADVAVFQEVTPEWQEALRGLADLYPHQLPRGRKDSKGAALLSKHPVRRLVFEELPGRGPIGAAIAEVEGEVPFTILGIHSHKPTSAVGAESQRIYFEWLAEKCRAENASGRPVVLMGDFNSAPWSTAFRQFISRTHLRDTSRGVLFGATWRVHRPQRLMIDHAFVSPEWRVLDRRVGPDVGSDHRPLILDLAVATEG